MSLRGIGSERAVSSRNATSAARAKHLNDLEKIRRAVKESTTGKPTTAQAKEISDLLVALHATTTGTE
jgi:hypothetical protein